MCTHSHERVVLTDSLVLLQQGTRFGRKDQVDSLEQSLQAARQANDELQQQLSQRTAALVAAEEQLIYHRKSRLIAESEAESAQCSLRRLKIEMESLRHRFDASCARCAPPLSFCTLVLT